MEQKINDYSTEDIAKKVEKKRASYADGNFYNKEMSLGAKDVINKIKHNLHPIAKSIDSKNSISEINTEKKKYNLVFRELEQEISSLTHDLDSSDWMFAHEESLNSLASAINEAEDSAIKLIKEMVKLESMNNDIKAQNSKLEEHEKSVGKNFVDIDNGIYKLTSATNPVPIQTVLGDMIKDGETWYIDYSDCESQYIKNKMKSALGGSVDGCYLTKGTDSRGNETYLLVKNKQILSQRALIWEGVKLTPPSLIKANAHNNLKEIQKNEEIKITDKLSASQRMELLKTVPLGLKEDLYKLGSKLQKNTDESKKFYPTEFFSATENALNDAIVRAKREGYELSTPPISKDGYTANGNMFEIHLINSNGEVDRTLFTEKISENLFDVFDDNEGDLVSYLTSRIQKKWQEADYLTKRENILTNNKGEKITQQEKENTLRGLGYMSKLVDNLIETEGDSRDDDDQEFIGMKKYVRDAIYNIQNGEPTKQDINDIIDKLYNKFHRYQIDNNSNRKILMKAKFSDLLQGKKAVSISAIREIGNAITILDNKHTIFLRDEIIENDDLEIKETSYNNCFKKIGEMLTIPEGDGPVPENIKQNIDSLYSVSSSSKGVFVFLTSNGMLPKSTSFEDKKIKELCEKTYNIIENKKHIIESFNITSDDMKKSLQIKKNNLEIKENKTSDDIISLNSISLLLNNEDALQKESLQQTETMKDSIKYTGIDSEIKGSIGSRLIKEGGGAIGTNADIYNDSIGVGGWFDRSDENASKVGPVLKEIAIEVAICAVAIAVGTFTAGLGTGAIYSARGALLATRLTGGVIKSNKIKKLFVLAGRLTKMKNYKSLARGIGGMAKKGNNIIELTNKVGSMSKLLKYSIKGTAMVMEGTAFHLSSTVMHNALSGGDLSKGINPLGYMDGPNGEKIPNWKGYAQSIAFLGVLKNLPRGIAYLKNLTKVKGANAMANIPKANFGSMLSEEIPVSTMKKILNGIGSLGGEMLSLMGTEQILSLTFDQHLAPITGEGFIHMIGMVAGLRGYNMLKGKGQLMVKEYKKSGDGKSIDLLTLEVTRDGKSYETVLNSKGEVIRTTDPMLKQGMEVKINEYGARSEISNRSPANRNNTADYIAKNRYENGQKKANEGVPTEVQVRNGEKVKIDHNGKHKDIIDQYKSLIKETPQGYEKQLEALDIQLAERITLDKGRSIEYTSEAEAKSSFEQLSKMEEYDGTLRTYKNFEGKWCIEKLSSNTIMPNIYISIKGMEGWRGVDYTGATIKNFEIPIKNLKTGDQIFSEFGGRKYEFAKKENGNWEVISEGGRFEQGNEVKLNKNKDGTMTFERIGDGRKMEISEIGLKRFASAQSEVVIKDIIDPNQIEKFVENFDVQIMSDKGITIDGKNYKMIYESNMTQNQNKKGTWKFIVDGKVETPVQAETMVLPENSGGNRIREKYYELRDKYVGTEIAKSGKDLKIKEQKTKALENPSAKEEISNVEPFKADIKNPENFEYKGKREKYEQAGKEDIDAMIKDKVVNLKDISEPIKKRQKSKPEYDANGNPRGAYKTAIEGMQKYLKDNGFYQEGEISVADGKMGKHTKNALSRYQAKTIETGLKITTANVAKGKADVILDANGKVIGETGSNIATANVAKGRADISLSSKGEITGNINIKEFNKIPKSELSEPFIKEFGDPKNKIDLGNGEILYTSDILQKVTWEPTGSGGLNQVLGYKYIVGYAKHNGKIEPRIFYRSGSEGAWRSTPGEAYGSTSRYSKGTVITRSSYETTTRVDPRVGEKFDSFKIKEIELDVIGFSANKLEKQFLSEQMKQEVSMTNKLFSKYSNAVDFYRGKKTGEVIEGYKDLVPEGLDYKSMKKLEGKEYTYTHDFLGKVEVTVCELNYNGELLNFHFARSKSNQADKVWIENIVSSDARLNSFGIYNKQVNAGPLTAKPIDYISQAPSDIHRIKGEYEQIDYFDKSYLYGNKKYIDIRDLYQGNPIIQKFKELDNINYKIAA